jgi:hypothetical protein
VFNSQFEKEGNMFGIGTSMENPLCYWRTFYYLRGYLSLHLHVQILCLGGVAMKTTFQMLAF